MYVDGAGAPGVDIGSLEGNGIVYLGEKFLSVGRNNLDTTFSGLLASYDGQNFGGVLKKVGEGTLTLSGPNTYADHTTVLSGALVANNTTGSATGTGPVKVQAGTLGGKGTIAGPVTIGVGIGTGAVLAPSAGLGQLAILTMQQTLTFKPDGSYSYKLNTNNARADQAIANGVAILSGAQFSFQSLGNRSLPVGTIFIAISNTSADPIAGAFINLPDGSTFTAGRNNFQVSYSGGDGNDLTLTVVP
jgi:autotransporter-associated beta strand protein